MEGRRQAQTTALGHLVATTSGPILPVLVNDKKGKKQPEKMPTTPMSSEADLCGRKGQTENVTAQIIKRKGSERDYRPGA